MHPALTAMLTDTFTHEAYVGQDGYGAPTYAAPVTRKGRLEIRIATVITAQGPMRVPQTRVFFGEDFALDQRDRLTCPDGTTPRLQVVTRVTDAQGHFDHYEVAV